MSSGGGKAPARDDDDLKDLYENAPCGYLSLRPDGRIVRVNATLCTWLGYAPDALIGKRLLDLLTVAGSMFYETHFAPLLRMQGYFHEVALDFKKAGGERIMVIANAIELRNEAGEPLFVRLALFQATERRQYERDLVEAKKKIEQLNNALKVRVGEAESTGELREQFIAVLGHDLRNPLASIDAGINLLQRASRTDKSLHILHLMKASVARMSGLIDNVLDLTRARLGGGIQLQVEAGRELAPTLQQVIDELRLVFPDRTIETHFRLEALLDVDHVRIAQLFSNLLANALTHGAEDQPIRIEAISSGAKLELSVTNGGDPIPPTTLPHLFKPFYRGDFRPSLQGLGLGLYIAWQIAEAHGGTLDVSSTDQETRFWFRMERHDVP